MNRIKFTRYGKAKGTAVKSASITTTKLIEGNKRMCLSAKRGLELCYQCKQYPTCESKIVNSQFDSDKAVVEKAQAKVNKMKADFTANWGVPK